jgi:hypothetical protein
MRSARALYDWLRKVLLYVTNKYSHRQSFALFAGLNPQSVFPLQISSFFPQNQLFILHVTRGALQEKFILFSHRVPFHPVAHLQNQKIIQSTMTLLNAMELMKHHFQRQFYAGPRIQQFLCCNHSQENVKIKTWRPCWMI